MLCYHYKFQWKDDIPIFFLFNAVKSMACHDMAWQRGSQNKILPHSKKGKKNQ